MSQYPYFYVYRDAQQKWRWRFRTTNEKIIADSGQGYVYKSDCEHGIELMKREAPGATIVYES